MLAWHFLGNMQICCFCHRLIAYNMHIHEMPVYLWLEIETCGTADSEFIILPLSKLK